MTITTFTVVVGRCATPCGSAGGHCRHARRLWPPLEQPGHARAAVETAGYRLGRRRSRRRARPQLRRGGRADCQAADRRGKFALGGSVGLSVGLSVGSGRGIEPVVLVCVLSGCLCVLRLCVSGVSESGFFCLRPCLCAEVGLRLCVCAPFGAIPPSRNPLVLPFRSLVRSRLRSRGDGKRRCRARLRLRLRLRWVVGWVLLVGAQSRTRARVE